MDTKFEILDSRKFDWKVPKKLISANGNMERCPKCNTRLRDGYTLVSRNAKQCYKIPGRQCIKCDSLYVTEKAEVRRVLTDNEFARKYSLDDRWLWNASERERERKKAQRLMEQEKKRELRRQEMRNVPSAVVMIGVRFANGARNKIVIVNEKKYQDTSKQILHYAAGNAREVLSAAFAGERERKGNLNGTNFEVEWSVFKDSSVEGLPSTMAPIEWNIRSGGGYGSSVVNRNFEIVDLLIYSHATKRYEILKGTHDKREGVCFVDGRRCRAFVRKYGDPGLSWYFETRGGHFRERGELQMESALHGFGYSVSQNENLSDRERQEILADFIDLGIRSDIQVARFLDTLISLHPQDKYYIARDKWHRDKKFVENYKANPARFLFGRSKDGK